MQKYYDSKSFQRFIEEGKSEEEAVEEVDNLIAGHTNDMIQYFYEGMYEFLDYDDLGMDGMRYDDIMALVSGMDIIENIHFPEALILAKHYKIYDEVNEETASYAKNEQYLKLKRGDTLEETSVASGSMYFVGKHTRSSSFRLAKVAVMNNQVSIFNKLNKKYKYLGGSLDELYEESILHRQKEIYLVLGQMVTDHFKIRLVTRLVSEKKTEACIFLMENKFIFPWEIQIPPTQNRELIKYLYEHKKKVKLEDAMAVAIKEDFVDDIVQKYADQGSHEKIVDIAVENNIEKYIDKYLDHAGIETLELACSSAGYSIIKKLSKLFGINATCITELMMRETGDILSEDDRIKLLKKFIKGYELTNEDKSDFAHIVLECNNPRISELFIERFPKIFDEHQESLFIFPNAEVTDHLVNRKKFVGYEDLISILNHGYTNNIGFVENFKKFLPLIKISKKEKKSLKKYVPDPSFQYLEKFQEVVDEIKTEKS